LLKFNAGRYFYSLKQQLNFILRQLKEGACYIQLGARKKFFLLDNHSINPVTHWVSQGSESCGLVKKRQLVWQRI
jgi:hypothetical protein